jgi:hypothetical protein
LDVSLCVRDTVVRCVPIFSFLFFPLFLFVWNLFEINRADYLINE